MEIYRIGEGTIKAVALDELYGQKDARYWIIATPEEICKNNEYFRFQHSTVQECMSAKQHPRLEVYDDFSFGVLNFMEKNPENNDSNWLTAKELNFYLSPRHLILVSRSKNRLVDGVKREVLEGVNGPYSFTPSLSRILYIFMDRLTSMDNIVLKEIESRIAALEEQVLEDIKKDFTREIISLRKQLLFLKRYYEPLMDIAEGLEENENGVLEEGSLKYFRILINRIQRLNQNVLNLRDYVTQVREAYQAQVDISMNRIMKVFTVITAIFLPLTLIAGWYGMNFEHMPELKWIYGYPYVFGLSILVVCISLFIFSKHHYI